MKKTIRVLLDILFAVFWGISLVAFPVHAWIIQQFGGGISMDQILFHVSLPHTTNIQGTFLGDVMTILWKAALVFIFILFLMISCKLLRKMFQGKKPILMFLQFCYFLMFALGLFLFVKTVYLYQKDFQLCSSIAGYWKTTELFDHCAVPDKDKIKFPPIRRNCILIFLESMETTYADSKIFGEDLTPGLTALAKKNFSFTGHNQVNGTGWTSAGMTAVLYGLPRLSNLEEGFFGRSGAYQTFMPEMPSLLKIAAAQKYNILFVEGAPLSFQNKNLFFSDIQYKWLQGGELLESDPEYKQQTGSPSLGVNDKISIRYFKNALTKLAESKAPFFAMYLTVDTHFSAPGERDGYLDPSVKRKYNDMRDVISEQSRMISELAEWIQKQDFYKNTVVVIVGDHLAMRSDIYERFLYPLNTNQEQTAEQAGWSRNTMSEHRQIYNCFMNLPFDTAHIRRNRKWAAFDLAPTILHAMGVQWDSDRLGIGTSLFSDSKTLLEEKGIEYYERESRKRSDAYRKILIPE